MVTLAFFGLIAAETLGFLKTDITGLKAGLLANSPFAEVRILRKSPPGQTYKLDSGAEPFRRIGTRASSLGLINSGNPPQLRCGREGMQGQGGVGGFGNPRTVAIANRLGREGRPW